MPKTWFNVQASGEAKGEIAIRGLIGEWGITDRDLIAQVEALGDVKDLTVRINSRGGEVDHAVGIFNFLRDHAATVHVIVDGVAMSSGSIIAMAGDKITMKANAVMMIHNPWTFAAGNAKQLRAQADILDKFESAMRQIYIARTGKNEEEVKAMLDGPEGDGIYMTAAEAKAEGFADEVEAIEKKGASALAFACALGIPAEVLAKIEAQDSEQGDGKPADDPAGDPAAGADGDGGDADANQAPADPLADQVSALAASAGLGEFSAVIALACGSLDEAKARIESAREIRALCAVAKLPNMAGDLIKANASVSDARAKLCDALAHADEQSNTSSQSRISNPLSASGAAVWDKIFPPAKK